MPIDDVSGRATNQGFYVHLHETPDGKLDLVLSGRGRQEFSGIAAIRDRYGTRAALAVLLDDHLHNGWQFVPPSDIGAFTSGPLLSREIERDASGAVIAAGRVYWFPAYTVLDEIEELRRNGFVEFWAAR